MPPKDLHSLPLHLAGVALATALILLLPLTAMQLIESVRWTAIDFLVAAGLLFGTGSTWVLVVHQRGDIAYRLAATLGLAATLMLIWANLAVGFIGAPDNPANLMYLGVPAAGLAGSLMARLRPRGMARTLWSMAAVQILIAVIALAAGLGGPRTGPNEILVTNGLFVVMFGCSAWLFARARNNGDYR